MSDNPTESKEKLTCPNCLTDFKYDDMFEANKKRAAKILHENGFSLRTIGRLLDMHQQSVKYWAGKPQPKRDEL